jgi:membrane protease YdiL (CAAX protease family)
MSPSPSRSSTLPRARARKTPPRRGSYLRLSRQPWHILCFLLPFIIAYEIGSAVFLSADSGEIVRTVSAQSLMARAFDAFGPLGIHVPAVVMVVVLFLWHLMIRDSWRIRPGVLLAMAIESALWTFPLLVLVALIDPTAFANTGDMDPQTWSLGARLTISVGAGLYEELLFRMVAIAAFHFVLVDLFHVSRRIGSIVSVVLAAIVFGVYHTGLSQIHPGWLLFYSAAGIYFGTVFMTRGFGIVVATHAIYDIIALVVMPPQ